MDSDNDSHRFPKCQTHAYTKFENGCSENSTQKLLTKYSTEENNKHVIAGLGRSVLGKTVPSVLGKARGRRHNFYQYLCPLAQFFPIRTSRPANNIYIWQQKLCAIRFLFQIRFFRHTIILSCISFSLVLSLLRHRCKAADCWLQIHWRSIRSRMWRESQTSC